MKRMPLAAALVLAVSPWVRAEAPPNPPGVETKEITYRHGATELTGFMAWDAKAKGKQPGVLVVHEWWGHNQHARNQAIRLAKAGYVGLALDMYGKGKVTTHPEEAQAFMLEAMKEPELMKARFGVALDVLKKDPHVDPERIAAIGYCFGGAVALTMARSGVDLDAVVTFHGALGTQSPAQAGQVKARVLVCNGADDPMVGPDQVEAFKKEMTAAGAKFDVLSLAGAKHSFTNPDADKVGMPALAYNAGADQQSWEAMLKLFREVFGR